MTNLTANLVEEYVRLWMLVDAFQFNPNEPGEDQIVWMRTADGHYSAASAYQIQFDGSFGSLLPKKLWQVWAPSRCKVFLWLMLQNRVWTTDRLQQREWPNNYFCPLCYRNLETVEHLFVECPLVKRLWTRVANWVHERNLQPEV